MYGEISGPEDWKKRQAAIKRALEDANKRDSTKILAQETKEMDLDAKKELQMNCEMAERVFHEGMEMYRDGDFTFSEFVEDLYRTLKAIQGSSKKEKDDDEE